MKDGRTRPISNNDVASALFLARNRATIVILEGAAAGTEYALTRESYGIGRGDEADIRLVDDSVSSLHAQIDLASDGFRIRDNRSTNGTFVNGSQIAFADLKHGDKITIGEHTLQYLQETKERAGSYDLSGEM